VSDWDGEQLYYASDLSGTVMAMVDDLVEQYRYSPSGVPYGLPAGDLNGDWHVEDGAGKPDYDIWLAATTAYQVRADLNFVGTVNAADQAIITANSTVNLGRGKFSTESVRNIKGYQGCEVFGEGLHTVWDCGRERDSAIEVYMSGVGVSGSGSTQSLTINGGRTWNGNCYTDCGVNS